MGFSGGSVVKNSPGNAGHKDSIPGSGRSPAGNGNPLQNSCLGNQIGQSSLAGYSPGGCKVRHDLVTKQQWNILCIFRHTVLPSDFSSLEISSKNNSKAEWILNHTQESTGSETLGEVKSLICFKKYLGFFEGNILKGTKKPTKFCH